MKGQISKRLRAILASGLRIPDLLKLRALCVCMGTGVNQFEPGGFCPDCDARPCPVCGSSNHYSIWPHDRFNDTRPSNSGKDNHD